MSDSFKDIFLENNTLSLDEALLKRRNRIMLRINPGLKRAYAGFASETDPERKNAYCAKLLNAFEQSAIEKAGALFTCAVTDLRYYKRYRKDRVRIDHSDHTVKDYFSVMVIAKDEGSYLKEYVLFYKAIGADRLYFYDNCSSDNTLEVLDPFIRSGFVVYQKWPGADVQTSAYRHALKKTRKRTKWLAVVDADEFLYSPKGDIKKELKAYEKYPGIGANWKLFGPSGHDKRPEGLVTDNYNEVVDDDYGFDNRHIKSIVQPGKVLCMYMTHFPIYKGKQYAVDEQMNELDNTNSFIKGAGKAFSRKSCAEVFRINHYRTKSIEELQIKCAKGYIDGKPNAVPEDLLAPYNGPMKEDYSIRPWADLIRGECYEGK